MYIILMVYNLQMQMRVAFR